MTPNNQPKYQVNKILLCGLLLCLLGAAGKGYGQEVDWNTERIYDSEKIGGVGYSSIGIDSNSNPHIFYATNGNLNHTFFQEMN